MPVLCDRPDVIVPTDEAHRSQYDTLALNVRCEAPAQTPKPPEASTPQLGNPEFCFSDSR